MLYDACISLSSLDANRDSARFVLMLLILSLLLLIIVRVVRSDLTKYLDISEEDLSAEEEQGSPFLLKKCHAVLVATSLEL